ncbi:flagellin N-terminal helical domain-containing protein [Georgenia subflava]|uniref:Flagellin n=1 Tax=Georgenia subflava TaxID=1622177 RepID=A0A6N7EMX7_9MICO|nr:flagellin [Georgenia subflava]MPV38443.1 flagellin [Georgenia subflava]
MAFSVNNNIAATNAYRNLASTQNDLSSSLEKLSSGFRINRAADDAAGLAISEGLRSQVGGLQVAVRNAQDGISVVQTAEGALTETHAILQRMRDLSVQAANTGGLSADAKGNIQTELDELKAELTRIADTTQFNGTNLLDGTYSGTFQVGANAGEKIDVDVTQSMSAAGLGVDAIDVESGSATWTAGPGSVDFAAATAPATAITIAHNGSTHEIDLTGWATGGTSTDAAKNHALTQQAFDRQLSGTQLSAKVDEFGGVTITGPSGAAETDVTIAGLTATYAADSGTSGGEAAIGVLDAAIQTVSDVRADLGAKQNRLDHTINSLNVSIENLSASESRIRDTDMAQEMASFTRSQILSQAGTAMLAQANQIPQGILQLLQ